MSLQGRSHIKRNIVCQDCSGVFRISNNLDLGLIADGVGSCKLSDKGSKCAVETAKQEILSNVTSETDKTQYIEHIRSAFIKARNAVKELSANESESELEYDTTLTIALYDGERIYYGHSGDGGIIALLNTGEYVKVTEPQKGPDRISVMPLRLDEGWKFGECGNVASFLMATDGVYDSFFPYLLAENTVKIYVPLISYFIDNEQISISENNESALGQEIQEFLLSDTCSSIEDDMTVVAMFNSESVAERKDISYYAEPDWSTLEKKWKEKAYSSNKPVENEPESPIKKEVPLKQHSGMKIGYHPKNKKKKNKRAHR